MITTPPTCSSACLRVECRPDDCRAETQQDEDRREARDEQQARHQHPSRTDALAQVGRCHADDRREVAGYERQYARRQEEHEARRQRQRDAHAGGGVEMASSSCAWLTAASPRHDRRSPLAARRPRVQALPHALAGRRRSSRGSWPFGSCPLDVLPFGGCSARSTLGPPAGSLPSPRALSSCA